MKEKLTNPLLAPFRERLLATAKPSVEMQLTLAEDLPLWQSKVGGKPYLPLNVPYPTAENGNPLTLLAQINFEEVPEMEGYPKKGILQFFVDSEDDLIGSDFDNPQNTAGFRVLYHADITKDTSLLQQDFPQVDENEFYLPFSFGEEFSIRFEKKEQFISITDFSFENLIPDYYDLEDEIRDAIYDSELYSSGHRIGGYPYFTQHDPRAYDTIPKDYELLLQLDSDNGLMWGDCGVGNFFIHPEDLKRLDFSKVAYTWDCG